MQCQIGKPFGAKRIGEYVHSRDRPELLNRFKQTGKLFGVRRSRSYNK
jgi:hypothetical protein